MIYEAVYLFAYRLLVIALSLLVGIILIRSKDRKSQLAATMVLIPLLLRALGGK